MGIFTSNCNQISPKAEKRELARALNDQYVNKRHLVTAHLDKLFAFERIQRESVLALMSFISTFRENVAVIKTLGVDDLSGLFIVLHQRGCLRYRYSPLIRRT